MRALAIWLILFLTTWLAMIGVAIALAGWRLDRHNRVDPRVSSPAPLRWVVWPTEPARLHRRLRGAVGATTALGPRIDDPQAGSPHQIRQEIAAQAVVLDRDLVAASRLAGPQRRQAMRTIRPYTRELEVLSRRLIELQHRADTPYGPAAGEVPADALGRISERLTLLEHAEAELSNIERANGLLDPDATIATPPTPGPTPTVGPATPAPGAPGAPDGFPTSPPPLPRPNDLDVPPTMPQHAEPSPQRRPAAG